jgi:cyclohexa-1,5-dienecarbonyl-CoA hydratase
MMWTKKAIKAGMGVSFSEGLRAAEVIYMRGCMETKDAKEGITAFLEKRKPVWKDE